MGATMRVLVVGMGVIGSYLAHAACAAGNDVTAVARGAWGASIGERGLAIHHRFQHSTTVDHPHVAETIPQREHFDVAFSVMRQDQQLAALPELAETQADALVLVGNNVRAEKCQAGLIADGFSGRILFGFQSTSGAREPDRVECVRWGAAGLDVGPLHGVPAQGDIDLLARVFTGPYKPHWTHDFNDWLLTHAAAVVPMALVSALCGYDLHQASSEQLHRLVTAQGEAYSLLLRTGHQILPEGDERFFDGGILTRVWNALVWAMAHTAIGTLCIDEHCRHAPDEMQALADGIEGLRAEASDLPMPAWDSLASRG